MILTQLIVDAAQRNTLHLSGMHHCNRSASRIWQSEIRHQLRKQCQSWCEMLAVARELRRGGDLSRREKRAAYSLADMPTAYADLGAEEEAGEMMAGDRWDGQ